MPADLLAPQIAALDLAQFMRAALYEAEQAIAETPRGGDTIGACLKGGISPTAFPIYHCGAAEH